MSPNPLRNLLMKPKLWWFVGVVSSLVGLFCFARSSSFKILFGEPNFLKMSLYTAICCIIMGFMLFAYKWRLPMNILFTAHIGFVVLMLTSLFTFFCDERLEPDCLSLISYASFAVVSLSLSRLIGLGFEVDFFNFFLGIFFVGLMKNKRWLAFVGAPICYVLILLLSYLDSQPRAETVSDSQLLAGTVSDSQLHARTVSVTEYVPVEIDTPNGVDEGAHSGCENGYFTILREERVLFPADIEARLSTAVAAGFADDCCHVFIVWRRQLLDDKLLKIRIQKLNLSEIDRVPLNFLEDKIKRWNTTSDYVLRILLPDERNLCHRVFSEFPHCGVFCFNELCQRPMIQLLNFADAIAAGNGSPERLFRILSLYATLRHLLPDFDSLFSDQYSVFLRDRAVEIWRKLGKEIKGVFMDLENLIRQESQKMVLSNGGLHPITHYIMNYLGIACKSWRTLEHVFRDSEHPSRTSSEIGDGESSSSPFSSQVTRIMDLLHKSLETISERYEDSVLCSVFLMNNVGYIVRNAKRSEVGRVMGDERIKEHVGKVREYLVEYKRKSWRKLVEMLTTKSVRHDAEKVKLIMSEFEGICEAQSKWVVFDEQLREKVRSSLKKALLDAHEKFMARFHDVEHSVEGTRMMREDFVAGINKLFKGKDELKNCRNIQPAWTLVKPTAEDSYEWTKHGQQKVLNSTYPRYHYWCIYKLNRGCQAIKQVQQKRENPEMYETKYIGFHTCS